MHNIEIQLNDVDYNRYDKLKKQWGSSNDSEFMVNALRIIELHAMVAKNADLSVGKGRAIWNPENENIPDLHVGGAISAPAQIPDLKPGLSKAAPAFKFKFTRKK
jgi:hypothetical protein